MKGCILTHHHFEGNDAGHFEDEAGDVWVGTLKEYADGKSDTDNDSSYF